MRGRNPGPINSVRERALINALLHEQDARVSAFNAILGAITQDVDTIRAGVDAFNDALSPWRAQERQNKEQTMLDAVAEAFDIFYKKDKEKK